MQQREPLTIQNGIQAAIPVAFGYVPVGFACGIVGTQAGMSPFDIGLLSLILYAGSAQFIFASLFTGSAFALVLTIFLVNLRHLLYAASLAQKVKQLPWLTRGIIGTQITDETFSMANLLHQKKTLTGEGLIALNVMSYTAWFTGNVLGALLGQQFDFFSDAQFLLVAMFAAILMLNIVHAKHKVRQLIVLLTSAMLIIIADSYHAHPINIIVIACVSAAIPALIARKKSHAN